MEYFIGIDPGKKGGLAVINKEFVEAIEMPLLPNGEISAIGVEEFLNYNAPTEKRFCILEKAQSMPKQGVKSTFNYGVGYGILQAILILNGISYQEIQSQKWKKEFSLIKKNKSESITVAEKLFPEIKFITERGRLMDGKAEALLMAEFARRTYDSELKN